VRHFDKVRNLHSTRPTPGRPKIDYHGPILWDPVRKPNAIALEGEKEKVLLFDLTQVR
jgi:hypothetical protein